MRGKRAYGIEKSEGTKFEEEKGLWEREKWEKLGL